jgi:phage baseplate assembly protein W
MNLKEREAALFGTDLKLRFRDDADLSVGRGDLETVSGRDNLQQALILRLLIHQGELFALSHPRYGSRVRELIGEPMDRENLDLLRRYVRKALKQDPRVSEVVSVTVSPRRGEPGALDVLAVVTPISGPALQVEVALDVG